jgi:hypothetical protein
MSERSALTEQVLGAPQSVAGVSHPARGNALRGVTGGAGVRLMICLAGLLLAVPLQRNLDSCDLAPTSQEKLLPIFPQDEFLPPLKTKSAAEKIRFP